MTKKQNIGNAGEYFISALLSAKDFVVTVTLGGNIGYDLLIENPNGKTLKLSVKTALSDKINGFILSEKCEDIKDDNLYYAFVKLNKFEKMPDYWIVPARIVAEIIKESNQRWLITPGKDDQYHKETSMRKFFIKQNEFIPDDWLETLKKYERNIEILESHLTP